MDTITITMKKPPGLYLEADVVSPDVFAGKTAMEIAGLPVYEGNTTSNLGAYFDVSGKAGKTPAETRILVKGNVKKVKYLGFKMSAGEVVVHGSTDLYAGAWMTGGTMHVKGDVESFAAIAMRGGELIIEGNAGNYLGAAFRGDWQGMSGGRILVKGNVGSDLGMFITGGDIVVNGNADIHVATHARGGRIIIKGNVPGKIGGQMVEGDIIVFGTIGTLMPGFKPAGEVELEVEGVKGRFSHYIGDTGEQHKKRKGRMVYGNLYHRV